MRVVDKCGNTGDVIMAKRRRPSVPLDVVIRSRHLSKHPLVSHSLFGNDYLPYVLRTVQITTSCVPDFFSKGIRIPRVAMQPPMKEYPVSFNAPRESRLNRANAPVQFVGVAIYVFSETARHLGHSRFCVLVVKIYTKHSRHVAAVAFARNTPCAFPIGWKKRADNCKK